MSDNSGADHLSDTLIAAREVEHADLYIQRLQAGETGMLRMNMRVNSKIFLLINLLVASTSAIADQCDSVAAAVAQATGATLERKSELDSSITLRHPAIDSMNIGCTDQKGNPNGVTSWVIIGSKGWAWSGHSDDPHEAPGAKTFSLLAAATKIAFGAPFQTIVNAAAKCAADAAKAENYHAQVDAAGLALDCLAGPDRISGAIAVDNPASGK